MRVRSGRQPPAIRTPIQAIEEIVAFLGVVSDLDTLSTAGVPKLDGVIPLTACYPAPVRTPCHAEYSHLVTKKQLWRRFTGDVPYRHGCVGSATDQFTS